MLCLVLFLVSNCLIPFSSHKSCGVLRVSVEGHWTYSWTYVLVRRVPYVSLTWTAGILEICRSLRGKNRFNFRRKTRVQESALMLVRAITCLRLIYLAGGHCHLEQPTNAMSWMEPEAQDFAAKVGIFCLIMAACAYDQSWDKSFFFAAQPNEQLSLVGHLDPSLLDEN